jgi:hypothetical protein
MADFPTLERIRAEYLEMPGLNLTFSQVQRLCGIDRAPCQAVLDALVEARFLHVRADGTYVRVSDGKVPPAMDRAFYCDFSLMLPLTVESCRS